MLTVATKIMWVLMAILIVAVTALLFLTVPDSSTPRGSNDRGQVGAVP